MGKYRNFTDQEKAEIIKKYREGATQAELAIEYKCSAPTIGNIAYMYSRGKGNRKSTFLPTI